MKWILILIISLSISSCCSKIHNFSITKDEFSDNEISFLAKNCDYISFICSEKLVKLDQEGNYKYDARVVTILERTICFKGFTPSKIVSIIGKPSLTTDRVIQYNFKRINEPKKFCLLEFVIENGTIAGQRLIMGRKVQN